MPIWILLKGIVGPVWSVVIAVGVVVAIVGSIFGAGWKARDGRADAQLLEQKIAHNATLDAWQKQIDVLVEERDAAQLLANERSVTITEQSETIVGLHESKVRFDNRFAAEMKAREAHIEALRARMADMPDPTEFATFFDFTKASSEWSKTALQ